MSIMYIDENCNSGFFDVADKHIHNYKDQLEVTANKYFNDNPEQEFISYCVVDFDNKDSCIYEFQRTVSYCVTLY